VDPTSGSLSLNFRFSATTGSERGQVTYNITNNVGTMVIRGETYSAVAYYTQVMGQPNPPGTIRWIDILGISLTGDNLAIVYFGLPPKTPNRITLIWEEDYTHQIYEPSGLLSACTFVDLAQKPNYNFSVSLPALTKLPSVGVYTGITIDGEEIQLQSNSGWMIIDGTNYTVTPISTVDCNGCGINCPIGCLQAPWWELHFIYSSPSVTGFGIYYIYPYNRTFVQLNYTLSVPNLATPAITYTANWSGKIPSSINWAQRAPFKISTTE